MNIHRRLFLLLTLLLVNGCGNGYIPGQNAKTISAPTVTIAQGTLRGVAGNEVQTFLGIPYAAPPVGARRWQPPAPAEAWTGVRNADTFGASCMQVLDPVGHGPWTLEYLVQNEVSEDCLFLNIWTPLNTKDKKYPVLVWIPGGGYIEGSGSVPIYDGTALAQRDIIVITINYRLNAFGFLAHPELSAEGNGHSGNYGILDMVAALQWVRDNIHAFGGDPTQVTVAGQSMGALSVYQLMTMPETKGLFIRAIAQSGAGIGYMGIRAFLSPAEAERQGLDFAATAGVTSLAELRALPAQTILKTKTSIPDSLVPFLLVQDAPPTAESYTDIPVLTGLTADEGSGLMPGYGEDTLTQFNQRLQTMFASRADTARQLWPARNDVEAKSAMKHMLRERGIAAMWQWARDRANTGSRSPVWLYLFSHVEPGPESERYGAFHSSEMPYVFETLDKASWRPFTAADRQLSQTLAGYWANFVKTGNPNGDGLPQWPVLEANAEIPHLLRLQPTPQAYPILPLEKRTLFADHVESGGQLGLF